jgi:IMP dehydrogenase
MRTALTFDDVSIIPAYSSLDSRREISLSSDCGWTVLRIPVISSPMDTVTGFDMIRAMRSVGGDGVHHRYCDKKILEGAVNCGFPIAVSPSMGLDFVKSAIDLTHRLVVVIDVAHGDSKPALDYAEACAKLGASVVSGNIVTGQAAERYYNIGVRIFRVGVGGGSSCSTRLVAGAGVPQLTAIMDIYAGFSKDCYIISDGGAQHSGDIVKALAAGADAVMTGRMLAGCEEAPGLRDVINGRKVKQYRGMASRESLDEAGKERNIEGIAGWVECDGAVSDVMSEIENGVRAGLSYVGARNIRELRDKTVFVQVTQHGHIEGQTRI